MKAIIWTRYGAPEVLALREIEKPVPNEDEVLIRIAASTVTKGDCEMRSLDMPFMLRIPMQLYVGFSKPKRIRVLGQEFSGTVEALGSKVTRFQVGDEVFASPGFQLGAYAQYICLPEESEESVIVSKPTNLPLLEAAAVPFGGMEALYFLRKAAIRAGEQVLINGAGGSIGTYAIQLAKYYGAHVTAVDVKNKLSVLQEIGADDVIDYQQQDFTKGYRTYDVIFDIVGTTSFTTCSPILNPGGRYLSANPRFRHLIRGSYTSQENKQVIVGSATRSRKDLEYLRDLIEAGKLTPVIDKQFPMQAAADAHRYVEQNRKLGNVLIIMSSINSGQVD